MRALIFTLLLLAALSGIGQTLIDSYSESNADGDGNLGANYVKYFGQSFTNSSAATLGSCKFYIRRVGSPTGSAYAVLFAHTGTYGASSGVPTGSALATSDAVDVSTLSTSNTLVTFTFTGANQYSLSASTYYCIELKYLGGDATNRVAIRRDGSSPSHSGRANSNSADPPGTWSAVFDFDACFYVYTAAAASPTPTPYMQVYY